MEYESPAQTCFNQMDIVGCLVLTSIHTYIYIYILYYIYIYVCMYVCLCIYIYIYTRMTRCSPWHRSRDKLQGVAVEPPFAPLDTLRLNHSQLRQHADAAGAGWGQPSNSLPILGPLGYPLCKSHFFLMGKSPFSMGKSLFSMGKSPFPMGKSPFSSGKSHFLMGKHNEFWEKTLFLMGNSTVNDII